MPPISRQMVKTCLRANVLTILTVSGVVGGAALGVILRTTRETKWPPREVMYVQYVGDLFLRMLKSIILPLIVASLVFAIGSLDLRLSGKIGGWTMFFFLTTTIIAVVEGIILTLAIHPGQGDSSSIVREGTSRNVTIVDTLMDLVRNMFPPNLVQACISQYRTVLKPPNDNDSLPPIMEWEISHEYVDGINILGIIVFCTVLGIALSKMGKKGSPLLNFFSCLGHCMMIITGWVIWVSPIGVFSLVSSKFLEIGNFEVFLGQLGMYLTTVLVGFFIHGFFILPAVYSIVTRTLPFRYFANMGDALATAFGTASSSATLPVTIRCVEDKNKVDPRVARLILPIGATINMDGTALYEVVAAIFIAQVRDVGLSIGQVIAVGITATAASIAAAGVPQGAIVVMVMVFDAVGLPAEDVTLIIACDWILDRFCTMINILGDAICAGIVNHISKNELEKHPMLDQDVQNEKPNPDQEVR